MVRPSQSAGEKRNKNAAFCTNLIEVLQGIPVELFGQNVRNLTCVCSNIQQNTVKKWIQHQTQAISKMYEPILLIDTKTLANVHTVLEECGYSVPLGIRYL